MSGKPGRNKRRFTMTAPSDIRGGVSGVYDAWGRLAVTVQGLNSELANICACESNWERRRARNFRGKRSGEGVEAELAVQIAPRAGVEFVKTGDSAENPGRVYRFREELQFFDERRVPQDGRFHF